MKHFTRKAIPIALVFVSMVALAGCGGGSSNNEAEEQARMEAEALEQRMAAQKTALMTAGTALDAALEALAGAHGDDLPGAIATANSAIADLNSAIAAAADVSDADKATYEGMSDRAMAHVTSAEDRHMRAEQETEDAEQAERDRLAAEAEKERMEMEAKRKREMTAMARKLYLALHATPVLAGGKATTSTNGYNEALQGEGNPTVSGDNLSATFNAQLEASDTTDDAITIKGSGTVVPALHGWQGADYRNTDDGTHHVVMYTNRGTDSKPFNEKHGTLLTAITGNTGFEIAQANLVASGSPKYVKSTAFATAGTKDHTNGLASHTGRKVNVSGTFDGVSGTFSCTQVGTTACQSTHSGADGITLAGGWNFIPASQTSMTATPDDKYLSYGWWSYESADGVADVKVFVEDQGGTVVLADTTANSINGKATYTGGAAGKYAIYNPLGGDSSAGAFTAKATLEADFTADKISGKLTEFMSGGTEMDWTVGLNGRSDGEGNITDSGFGGGTARDSSSRTSWTIDGVASDSNDPTWSGNFYSANSADAVVTDKAPPVAAGTFNAEYEVSDNQIGLMSGAFGADLDD